MDDLVLTKKDKTWYSVVSGNGNNLGLFSQWAEANRFALSFSRMQRDEDTPVLIIRADITHVVHWCEDCGASISKKVNEDKSEEV
jgi:hypothetical protein